MPSHYFAQDGSYGDAFGIVVIDNTEQWTDEDWEAIESASDYERVGVALLIGARYENGAV